MARTYQQRLDGCDATIEKIERLGQANSSDGGRSLTRADLAALYKERAYLEPLAARESNGGGISVRAGTPVDA